MNIRVTEQELASPDILSELRERRLTIRRKMGLAVSQPIVVLAMSAEEKAAIENAKAIELEAVRKDEELQLVMKRLEKLEADVASMKRFEIEDLGAAISEDRARRLTVARIIDCTSTEFKVSKTDIKSARRHGDIILPRHIAMFLAREMTGVSLPMIGRVFGGRDHSTIHNAIAKIKKHIDDGDAAIIGAISRIMTAIEAGNGNSPCNSVTQPGYSP